MGSSMTGSDGGMRRTTAWCGHRHASMSQGSNGGLEVGFQHRRHSGWEGSNPIVCPACRRW
jgi:hypothetical protein